MVDLIINISAAVIWTVLTTITAVIYKRIKKHEDKIKNESLAIQAMERITLLDLSDKYKRRGWASPEEKAAYENMFKTYEHLGPNGVMTKRYEFVMSLPESLEEKKND